MVSNREQHSSFVTEITNYTKHKNCETNTRTVVKKTNDTVGKRDNQGDRDNHRKNNLHLGPNDDSEEGEDDADVQPEVYVEDNH